MAKGKVVFQIGKNSLFEKTINVSLESNKDLHQFTEDNLFPITWYGFISGNKIEIQQNKISFHPIDFTKIKFPTDFDYLFPRICKEIDAQMEY